jgi:hypothetical protein
MNQQNTNNTQESSIEELRQAKKEAIQAMEQYFLTFDTWKVNLIEEVYNFLQGKSFEDAVYEYEAQATYLLSAFAKPAVNAIMTRELGEYSFVSSIKMLERLKFFCAQLDKEAFLVMFDLCDAKEFTDPQERTIEEWHEITNHYTKKLHAQLVKRGVLKVASRD